MSYSSNVLSKELDEIKKFLVDNDKIVLSLKEESRNRPRTQRKLQHAFSKVFVNKDTQKIFMIILDYASRSEKACPGSGMSLIKRLYSSLEKHQDKTKILKTKWDVKLHLESLDLSEKSKALLLEVLDNCDKNTRIKLKKSVGQKTYIELHNSYFFNTTHLISNKNLSHSKNLKVVAIDGYIENVSDLHHVFSHFSINEPERTLAIFCRGMSDDVLNTISVNNNRGTLKCLPFKVNFDLEDVNTLVDIAVVCGIDVISSLKGELISSIKLSEIKSIDELTVTADGVLIKNAIAHASVESHISKLQKKCDETQIEDVKFLLCKRISNLSGNRIDIAIPDDINFYSLSKELDEGIRLIASIANNSYNHDEAINFFYDNLMKYLRSTVSL